MAKKQNGEWLNAARRVFEGALIEGACFDQAEIDQAGFDPRNRTNLRRAKDWATYVNTWSRSKSLPKDAHLPVSAVFQDAPFAPEMVVVPNGYFTMGSPDDEPGREPHEEQQRYFVEHSFAVGRFAVTFDEWDRFIADGGRDKFAHADGSRGRWKNADKGRGKWDDRGTGRGNMPAVDMSWHDAKAYVAWLSDKTGKVYRLLHDVEWE
jgi:formylglycine-generating enzyme required for sulfatase activity